MTIQALTGRYQANPSAVADCFVGLALASLRARRPVSAWEVVETYAVIFGRPEWQHPESVDCTLTMAASAGIIAFGTAIDVPSRFMLLTSDIAAMMKLGVNAWIERALGITNNEGSGTGT